MRFEPHDYQTYAIEKIIEQQNVGLFLDMGMGKTVSTLTAIDRLIYDHFDVSKVLVIAPLRVAEDTWSREAEKWDHLNHLRISKVLGLERQRIAGLNEQADIYVINRENVEWLVELYGYHWPFDMVVIDELSSFKSSKSKRFRSLRKVRPLVKRLVGLTGTPAPNTLLDLWPQIYLLDQGERLGSTVTGYRDRFFSPSRMNGHVVYSWDLKPGADQVIFDKLSDLCVSMKASDWLSLPDRIDRIVPVTLSTASKKIYKKLERERLLTIDGNDLTAANAAVLSNKLLQLSNGAIYDDDGTVQNVHEAKLDALEDLVEAANGKPVLIFYSFKHDAKRITERLTKHKPVTLESSRTIADWNAKKIEVLLAHPASAGHGLNLQAGGNIIIWFGLTWSLELYQQANARLYRQGQDQSVIVHHLVTEGTLDEAVMNALANKAVNQDMLLDAVKAQIEDMNRSELHEQPLGV